MASFKEGHHIQDLKGRLHTTIYSRNRFGPISYTRTYNKYKWTDSRIKASICVKQVARVWSNDLSDDQYYSWAAFAEKFKFYNRHGVEYTPSAYDIFSKINLNRKYVGLPEIKDPPKKIIPQTFKSFTAEIISSGNDFDIRLHFKPAINKDTRIKLTATKFQHISSIDLKESYLRYIGFIDSSFKSGDSIIHLYRSVITVNHQPNFKIGFLFEPVSAISGLSGFFYDDLAGYRKTQ